MYILHNQKHNVSPCDPSSPRLMDLSLLTIAGNPHPGFTPYITRRIRRQRVHLRRWPSGILGCLRRRRVAILSTTGSNKPESACAGKRCTNPAPDTSRLVQPVAWRADRAGVQCRSRFDPWERPVRFTPARRRRRNPPGIAQAKGPRGQSSTLESDAPSFNGDRPPKGLKLSG